MSNEKEKLISLKEGLKIVKSYDENGELKFVDSLLKGDDMNDVISMPLFAEMVHSNVISYTTSNEKKKAKK